MNSASTALSLYLLRHADAGDPGAWSGDDAKRPLSPKGVRQSERLGRHLAAIRFSPDAILTSPKLRALQTAEIVGRALGREPAIDERLANGVDVRAVEEVLTTAGRPRTCVLVGHDPDFTDLLRELSAAQNVSMKKGAIARIDFDDGVRADGGDLRWLIPPDALPKDGS